MKYLVYVMSLMFVLAFVGCGNEKESAIDIKETKTEAVEDAVETVEEDVEKAREAINEHKCGEGKCGEGKCGGDKAKDAVKEVTDN